MWRARYGTNGWLQVVPAAAAWRRNIGGPIKHSPAGFTVRPAV